MSSDRFLEQVRVRFDASVAKSIVSAFRQEPLLWKSISDSSATEAWLNYAGSSQHLWTPGHYALFTTSQDLVSGEPGATLSGILTKAQTSLNSIRMTGLPPGNLADATGLALLIRDYNLNHPDWQGLTGFLQDKRNNLGIWKPAFAILPALVSDFKEFIASLLNEAPESLFPTYVDLIVHALFSIPLDETERLNQFTQYFRDANRTTQLLVLDGVANRGNSALAKLLATRFISVEATTEGAKAKLSGSESVKNYQQMAEMHRLAGQSNQATQAIQLAYEALNHSHAEALRNLALELEHDQPEEARRTWEEIIRLVPANESYRKEYAEFLIKLGKRTMVWSCCRPANLPRIPHCSPCATQNCAIRSISITPALKTCSKSRCLVSRASPARAIT
jgi:tetratricopeptide (TPR) repeat protein